MQGITLDRPQEATSYPSPFISPEKKDKGYHLQSAKAIYYSGWKTYNNPYGNYYRNLWDDNRKWARGLQSNWKFAQRPAAKNDNTKNPLLRNINFSAVNEMVKYCDIFVTMLEQSDLDIVATAINPAAAAKRSEIKATAEAYRNLRPFFNEIDQEAGMEVAPKNPLPYDFETQQELEMFFQVGFKLKQEMLVELGNETVLNDSDWKALRKMIAEDIRDTGFYMVMVESDTNNKIRAKYIDPINSGWEDYRGHKLKQVAKFWTIEVKTGAQIVAETGGELTQEELYTMATLSAGKYGNPTMPSGNNQLGTWGYINSDSPYNLWFYDNWKFPVMTAVWEDWEVYKYRRIKRIVDDVTEVYEPVPYNYEDETEGKPFADENGVERVITVESTKLHTYRQCKWVVGTEIVYQWGKVPNIPRNPQDVRFALCPVKIYRTTGAPLSQRLKGPAEIYQNAWYKMQGEIARARPSGVSINLRMLDNVATLEGKKINRYQVLELFNEEGTLLYADRAARDDMGNTISSEPIKPGVPVDPYAIQRWVDVMNQMSYVMQMESGLNEFAVSATQNPEQSATAVKAGIASANKSIQQYADAILALGEDIAIDVTGKLQMMMRNGVAGSYESSIGSSLLQDGYIDDSITIFTYGIKVTAKPTKEERMELKAEIRKAFSGIGTPTEGSPYLPDLLALESMIDNGTNMKLIALYASHLQRKNMKEMQQQEMQRIQANTQSQQQIAQSAAQAEIGKEQQVAQIRMQEYTHKINEDIRLAAAQSQFRTENQLITADKKSHNKINEKVVEQTLA